MSMLPLQAVANEFKELDTDNTSKSDALIIAIKKHLDFSKKQSYAEIDLSEPPAEMSSWELLVAYTSIAGSSAEKNEKVISRTRGFGIINDLRDCAEESQEALLDCFMSIRKDLERERTGFAMRKDLRDTLAIYRASFYDQRDIL